MATLSSELFAWAKRRPFWQQTILMRLARGDVPTSEDYRTIASQLARGDDQSPDIFTLPAAVDRAIEADPVRLLSLTIGENVNALMPGQTLTFAPNGLTVVYGDNGSGKTGYARLIKRFVGARVHEEVLSDIFSEGHTGLPDGQMLISVGDEEEETLDWHVQVPNSTRAAARRS